MRVCLVGDRGDAGDPSVSLGHLCLVPVVEASGGTADLVEVATLEADGPLGPVDIADEILALGPDVIGFTGMCNTYHRILRVAAVCKDARPDTTIILGGPQPSATDRATMDAFPAVDMIVRGEGEGTLREVLDAVRSGRDPSGIAGLTARSRGRVVRNPDRNVIRNLDDLPFPAFDRDRFVAGVANVEAGRGCPFACSYCSTSVHWQRRYRLKSAERLVDEIALLNATYGISTFCLVHDLFTVDRAAVCRFCDLLSARGLAVQWGCSARTDLVDEALLDRMASSGCVSVYFGIEAGSERIQGAIGKGLDLAEARRVIEATSRRRLRSTTSFIVGFPEESAEEVAATLGFCANLLPQSLVRIELHHLMYLAGTALHQAHGGALVRPDRPPVDMSPMPGGDGEDAWALIGRHPDLFPSFYAHTRPAHGLQASLAEVEPFGRVAFNQFRLSSTVAIANGGGDALGYYFRWRDAMTDYGVLPQRSGRPGVTATRAFFDATWRFLLERESAGGPPQMRELVRYEMLRSTVEWSPAVPEGHATDALSCEALLAMAPVANPTLRIEAFTCDLAALLREARDGGRLDAVPPVGCSVMFWAPSVATTMTRTLSSGARRLLDACTGERPGREIVAALGGEDARASSHPVSSWAGLLEFFYRQRILVPAGSGGEVGCRPGEPHPSRRHDGVAPRTQ
jgi:radical SAM superfamily enzyme YgiQ (UPF0313 family)